MSSSDAGGHHRAIQQFLSLAEQAGMRDSPVVQLLVERSRLDPHVSHLEDIQEVAEQCLLPEVLKRLARPFPFTVPRLAELPSEGVALGTLLGPDGPVGPWCLQPEALTRHVLLAGTTGSGKTTLLRVLQIQLRGHCRVLALDSHRDARQLVAVPGLQLNVVHAAQLPFNPLEPPPGVPPRTWLGRVVDGIGDAAYFHVSSRSLLLEHLNRLYEERGIYAGARSYPTLQELNAAVQAQKTGRSYRIEDAKFSIANRFQALDATLGQALRCQQGWPLEELLQQNLVIELDGLPNDHQAFFTSLLLLKVFSARVAQGRRNRGVLEQLVVVDEAHQLMGRTQQNIRTQSLLADYLALLRKHGLGIVVGTQLPSQLDRMVLANTGTQICMRLHGREELEAARRSLLLTPEQVAALACLPPGVAIVRQSDVPEPFLVQVPHLQLEEAVGDWEVEARAPNPMQALALAAEDAVPEQGQPTAVPEASAASDRESRAVELTPNQRLLLYHVATHADEAVTARYRALSWSSSTGTRVKRALVDQGYLLENAIKLQLGQGGSTQFLELTKQAYEVLGLRRTERGRGSFEHRYWARTIARWLQAHGFTKVQIEATRLGKAVDVAGVDAQGAWVAYEVTLHAKNLLDNVRKDLRAGFVRVVVCCTSKRAEQHARRRLAGAVDVATERVEFQLVQQFLPVEDSGAGTAADQEE